ncbi:adhesion G-protein coupled receptor G6-like [Saccoglossus kowalevskii]
MTCNCEIRWLHSALTAQIEYFENMNITGAECRKNGTFQLIKNSQRSDFTCNGVKKCILCNQCVATLLWALQEKHLHGIHRDMSICLSKSRYCYTCENRHTFGECTINTTQCTNNQRSCFTNISVSGNQYSVSKGCSDATEKQCDACERTCVCRKSHCNAFLPLEINIPENIECPHCVTSYANVDIQWGPTPAGTTAEVKCPFVSPKTGLTVTRKCNSNGEWGKQDTSKCDVVTTTPATHSLDKLVTMSTTVQNAPAIAKQLCDLTSTAEYFAAVDVYLAVNVIDNLLYNSKTSTTNIEVSTDLLKSVDNLYDVRQDVLVASQIDGGTASRLIKAIDQLALNVELQNETARIETENFIIFIVNLNTSLYSGISFSVSDNDQTNLDIDMSQLSSVNNMKSSIQLPSSLLDGHSFQDGSSRAQFISYKSSLFFKAVGAALPGDAIPTSNHVTSDQDVSNNTIYGILNSPVIGASIEDLIISDLREPVKVNFTWQSENLVNPQCVYWNYSLNDDVGGWSTDGCNVSGQSSHNVTTCECDHLTNFALLMDVYGTASEFDEGHQKALSIVSYIGCGISLLCMLLTLITFLAFRRLRKDNPTKILMNLCFAIFMSLLLFLAVSFSLDFAPIIPELCTTMAVLLHYFLLAVVMWMALEAFNMYLQLVKIFKTYIRHFMLKFCLIGWGIPVVIIAITLTIDIDNYGYHNNICWLSRYAFFAAFLAPVCLVLIFNTVIYILVVHQICSLNSKKMSTSDRYGKAAQLRGSVSLFVLLGITWALAILAISEAGLVVNYLFAIANSLQGLFIFIFFCALKNDVQNQWRDTFCSSCCLCSSTDSASTTAKKYLHQDTEHLPQNRCYDNTASSHL